jgi:tetratricopeptide (TPR) repeat protein
MRYTLWRILVSALLLGGITLQTAKADENPCNLKFMPIPVISNNTGKVLISVKVGDEPAIFQLDTGAAWSMIREDKIGDARTFRSRITTSGFGGVASDRVVRLPGLTIGLWKVERPGMFVGPVPQGGDPRVWGLIGDDILATFDIELNFAEDKVNFFFPSDCKERAVYWRNDGIAKIPFSRPMHNILLHMKLDGKNISAILDTGAFNSILNLRAADSLFDLNTDEPSMKEAGYTVGADGRKVKSYIHQFDKLEIGGLAFNRPWINIQEFHFGDDPFDLSLGYHQLRGLRLYISYKDHVVYATKASVPVPDDVAADAPSGQAMRTEPPYDQVDIGLINPGLAAAEAAVRAGHDDVAKAALDDLAAQHPNYAIIYYRRGIIETRLKDNSAALADLDHAIALFANYADAYQLRASVQMALHQDAAAVADLDVALRLKPDVAWSHMLRARLRIDAGDDTAALDDLEHALAHDPKLEAGYMTRGQLYVRRKEYEPALADFQQASMIAPNDANALDWLGTVYYRLDRVSDAIASASQAITLAPNNAHYLENRSTDFMKSGQLELALADCSRAIALTPRSADLLERRANIYATMHSFKDAVADYDSALAIDPTRARALYGRGLAKRQLGDAKGAKADLAEAVALQPDLAPPVTTAKH